MLLLKYMRQKNMTLLKVDGIRAAMGVMLSRGFAGCANNACRPGFRAQVQAAFDCRTCPGQKFCRNNERRCPGIFLQSLCAAFAGTDAHRVQRFKNEYFAVADFAGAGGVGHGGKNLFHNGVFHNRFQLKLG